MSRYGRRYGHRHASWGDDEADPGVRVLRPKGIALAAFPLFFWLVSALAWASVLSQCGCGGAPVPPPVVVTKVVEVPVTRRCATMPPPVMVPVAAPLSPPTCLPGMLCFPILEGMALAENVERLKSWVGETWTLCAPEVSQ